MGDDIPAATDRPTERNAGGGRGAASANIDSADHAKRMHAQTGRI